MNAPTHVSPRGHSQERRTTIALNFFWRNYGQAVSCTHRRPAYWASELPLFPQAPVPPLPPLPVRGDGPLPGPEASTFCALRLSPRRRFACRLRWAFRCSVWLLPLLPPP